MILWFTILGTYENLIEPDYVDLDNALVAVLEPLWQYYFHAALPAQFTFTSIYTLGQTQTNRVYQRGITQGPRAIFNALPK